MVQRLLIREIESMREAMIDIALKKGLSAKETLTLSKKLDSLLNQVDVCAEGKKLPD